MILNATNNLQNVSGLLRKPLFDVQFLITYDRHLSRGDYHMLLEIIVISGYCFFCDVRQCIDKVNRSYPPNIDI